MIYRNPSLIFHSLTFTKANATDWLFSTGPRSCERGNYQNTDNLKTSFLIGNFCSCEKRAHSDGGLLKKAGESLGAFLLAFRRRGGTSLSKEIGQRPVMALNCYTNGFFAS